MRILLVEDEALLTEALCQILRSRNSGGCGAGWRRWPDYGLSGQYDIILLDVMLPRLDGFTIARQLRAAQITTPHPDPHRPGRYLQGARTGLREPTTIGPSAFDLRELLARIRALTRRPGDVHLLTLTFSDLELNLRPDPSLRRAVRAAELQGVRSAPPSDDNPRMVPAQRVAAVQGVGHRFEAEDNNVEAYISFLRRKIHTLGSSASSSTPCARWDTFWRNRPDSSATPPPAGPPFSRRRRKTRVVKMHCS